MDTASNMIIGITGQSGSGKTSVSKILNNLGFQVIDADIVSRKVVETGTDGLNAVVKAFGQDILSETGQLNRKKLGEIVFVDAQKNKILQTTIFPFILREIADQMDQLFLLGYKYVFLDAPTLFESGADKLCSKVVSVIAPKELRLQRILERDGLSLNEAKTRLSAQFTDDFYASRSDLVIQNTGDCLELEKKVENMLQYFHISASE